MNPTILAIVEARLATLTKEISNLAVPNTVTVKFLLEREVNFLTFLLENRNHRKKPKGVSK